MRPLSPVLKEKKRYLAFRVESEKRISYRDAFLAVDNNLMEFAGIIGSAEAGLMALPKSWNMKEQKGIIRVSRKSLNKLRASLLFIRNINGGRARVFSVGASGILKKAREKWIGA